MSAVNNNTVKQTPQALSPIKPVQPLLNFSNHVQSAQVAVNTPWHERAIAHLDNCERRLDDLVPNSIIQQKIDNCGRALQNTFAPLKNFNDWLNKNDMGSWYKQLATFLVKLPMKAVRNIVHLLYSIIKGIFYTTVHPMKASVNLAKLIVKLAHELTKPETWSKIGAGILGASAGQALVTGNPFNVIGLGVGAGLVVGGITAGVIKTAWEAERKQLWQAIKEHLLVHVKALPEAALTGFLMGLIIGGIERAIRPPMTTKVDDYVKQVIKNNDLPESTQWSFDPSSGKITLTAPWQGKIPGLAQSHPDVFIFPQHSQYPAIWHDGVRIEILPKSTNLTALGKGATFCEDLPVQHVEHALPADIFGHIAQGYPSALLPQAASPFAAGVGAVSTLHNRV